MNFKNFFFKLLRVVKFIYFNFIKVKRELFNKYLLKYENKVLFIMSIFVLLYLLLLLSGGVSDLIIKINSTSYFIFFIYGLYSDEIIKEIMDDYISNDTMFKFVVRVLTYNIAIIVINYI